MTAPRPLARGAGRLQVRARTLARALRAAVPWWRSPPLADAVAQALAHLPRVGHFALLDVAVVHCDERRGRVVLRLRGDCAECAAPASACAPAVESFVRQRVAGVRRLELRATG